MTMAEDTAATSASNFEIKYRVDEHDCLHFAESLKTIGHQIYFVNWKDLNGREFKRTFSFNSCEFVSPVPVDEMDLIFVYKMEGFLSDLARFHRMLDRFEGLNVINDIATIRHNLDKSYLWELGAGGIKIIPSYPIHEAADRLSSGERLVIKPLKGERGERVFLANGLPDLAVIRGSEDEYFAQAFMPGIRDGERSLVFLGHEYQHAVIKRPSASDPHEFRCNESLGGTVAVYEPTAEEMLFAGRVLDAYEALGYPVHFGRVDLLQSSDGPVLLEAEFMNPSIYANHSNKGKQFGDRIAAYFDEFLRTGPGAAA